jgi:hypothetical protein
MGKAAEGRPAFKALSNKPLKRTVGLRDIWGQDSDRLGSDQKRPANCPGAWTVQGLPRIIHASITHPGAHHDRSVALSPDPHCHLRTITRESQKCCAKSALKTQPWNANSATNLARNCQQPRHSGLDGQEWGDLGGNSAGYESWRFPAFALHGIQLMKNFIIAPVSALAWSCASLSGCINSVPMDVDHDDAGVDLYSSSPSNGGDSGLPDSGSTGPSSMGGNGATVITGPFRSVIAGLEAACALRTNGTIACWGDKTYRATAPLSGTFESISMGDGFYCGVKTDHTLDCTEYAAQEFLPPLAPGAAAMPQEGAFVTVSAGYSHACAIVIADGSVVCWGAYMGEPPAGSFTAVSTGSSGIMCGISPDGTLACWGGNGTLPPPSGNFTSISMGFSAPCGIRTDGTLACWGDNSHGEATPPSGTFVSVSASDTFACGVRSAGTLACWGDNTDSRATPPSGRNFVSVSAGQYFACALKVDGTIACWGRNTSGEATPPAS